MRDAETPQQRAERRMREAATRLASFARCCVRKFWAQRVAARRTLRLRAAFLRKAAVRRSWNAARGHVWAAVHTVRDQAARRTWGPLRLAAALPDVFEQMRQAAAAERRRVRAARDALPQRKARVQLAVAARIGPAAAMALSSLEPRGDG